jgi:hypothetical protein
MSKLEIYCVTNKKVKYLENLKLKLVGVGKAKFNKNYISCKNLNNIQHKEKNYSELTFHYWFWKNKLKFYDDNTWIGFCQKRRFWIKSDLKIKSFSDLKKNILTKPPLIWKNYESVICRPIKVDNPKKMKLIKRGWRNLIKNPLIFFNNKNHDLELHFDMHHGHGVLRKSMALMKKEYQKDFNKFIKRKDFNPHIMFISKKKILEKWFMELFEWLFKCEKIFGLKNLEGYDQQRLYAYLAERFLSFWFKKNSKYIEWPWAFYEEKKY